MHFQSKKKLRTNEYDMRLVSICSVWDFHDAVQPSHLCYELELLRPFLYDLEKLHNKSGNDAADGYELLFTRGRKGQHQLMKIRRLMALPDDNDGSRMGTADSGTRGHSSPAADWLDLQCPDRQQLYSPLTTKTTPDKDIRLKALKLTHFHVNEAKLVLSDAWD